jgi:quinol monooxygenase YgiN
MTPSNSGATAVSSDYGKPITVADLFVTFELTVEPTKIGALKELMLLAIAQARTKPGSKYCVLLQIQSEPRLLTYEVWTNRAALDAHMASAQIGELGHQLRSLLVKPLLVTYMDGVALA